jgi:DNA-3-methyladenine glycosylase II
MYYIRKRYKIKGPYDFDLSVKLALAETGERVMFRDYLVHPRKIGNRATLFLFKNIGTTKRPILDVIVYSKTKFTTQDNLDINKIVDKMIDSSDLKEFYKTVEKDKVMKYITDHLYGIKHVEVTDHFDAFIFAICEQQMTLRVAVTFEHRIAEKFGKSIIFHGNTYYCFPTANDIYTSATTAKLKSCGVSTIKAKAIMNISKLVATKKIDLEYFDTLDGEDFIDELQQIYGIGPWSAKYIGVRGYGKSDLIMAEDSAIQKAIAHYYKIKNITPKKVDKIAEKWGEYRGLAGYYLLIAHKFDI